LDRRPAGLDGQLHDWRPIGRQHPRPKNVEAHVLAKELAVIAPAAHRDFGKGSGHPPSWTSGTALRTRLPRP